MRVGDLVKRVKPLHKKDGGDIGVIMSLQVGGMNPSHPCATIFWSKSQKCHDIAESLVEVISESG